MNWWDSALFDTCSLITLDKMLQDSPDLSSFFPKVMTLEECLSFDNLRAETEKRIRPKVTVCDLPPVTDISRILSKGQLSKGISSVDELIYVTAIHFKLPTVTGDRVLAIALAQRSIRAENMALILKALVQQKMITQKKCNQILSSLVVNHEFILPPKNPQNWETLKKYTFP